MQFEGFSEKLFFKYLAKLLLYFFTLLIGCPSHLIFPALYSQESGTLFPPNV